MDLLRGHKPNSKVISIRAGTAMALVHSDTRQRPMYFETGLMQFKFTLESICGLKLTGVSHDPAASHVQQRSS